MKLHSIYNIVPQNETRWFARLKSKHLPENSFRTYHPGYGNREYDWYQGVMDKIVELSK